MQPLHWIRAHRCDSIPPFRLLEHFLKVRPRIIKLGFFCITISVTFGVTHLGCVPWWTHRRLVGERSVLKVFGKLFEYLTNISGFQLHVPAPHRRHVE